MGLCMECGTSQPDRVGYCQACRTGGLSDGIGNDRALFTTVSSMSLEPEMTITEARLTGPRLSDVDPMGAPRARRTRWWRLRRG